MQQNLKEVRFEDANLNVGMKMQLLLQRDRQKTICYSTLIGYETGEYVLLKVPQENGFSVPIQVGDTVHIRVFSGLSVFVFVSYVESILLSPRNCMYLSFPPAIHAIPLRQAVRIKVNLAAKAINRKQAETGSCLEGVLGDLSLNGALLSADSRLGQINDKVSVDFSVRLRSADQSVKIKADAIIRNVRKAAKSRIAGGDEMDYGLEFSGISQNDEQMLQHFLYESVIERRQ